MLPRALLIRAWKAAHWCGVTPPLGLASPYGWALACHDMFEAGSIDVLDYAARHLHAAHPELEYVANLVAWFDAVPRHLPPPRPFRDDPAADVQVVRAPDSDAVLICFCAARGTLGLPVNFVHQWLGRLPASLVYLKDARDLFGALGFPSLAPDRSGSIAALRDLARELGGNRIYTLGVSRGGYAATYYGLELGAQAVLSLAGATDLTGEFVNAMKPASEIYLRMLRAAPDYAVNLGERYRSAQEWPQVMIAFSSGYQRDRAQAERMAGVLDVELIAVDGKAQHNVIDLLIRQGTLWGLLNRLLASDRQVRCEESGAP
jgi:hypothetical protein